MATQISMTENQNISPFETEDGRHYRLIPIREAAVLLTMTVQSLGEWRHQGYGPPSILIGRKRFYRSTDINDFLNTMFAENQVAA